VCVCSKVGRRQRGAAPVCECVCVRVCVCVCACVCVCGRERERERGYAGHAGLFVVGERACVCVQCGGSSSMRR